MPVMPSALPPSDPVSLQRERADWHGALQAATLFAIDPAGMVGVRLRAPAGPVRDCWLDLLRRLLNLEGLRRMPLSITDERLLGGLDLTATLAAGHPVAQQGLLAEVDGGVLLLAMAERLPAATAARLAMVLDQGEIHLERDGLTQINRTRFGVVALDEGIDADETLTPALRERFALDLDLSLIAPRTAVADADDGQAWLASADDILDARERLAGITVPEPIIAALCASAQALGIDSARACLLALRVARASAALDGNAEVTEDDADIAARLVLAPRATRLPPRAEPEQEQEQEQEPEQKQAPQPEPQSAEPPPQDQPEPEPPAESPPEQTPDPQTLEDRVLEAAQAVIPAGLLAQLVTGSLLQQRAASGKSGAAVQSGLRGRPAGTRRAVPNGSQRLHVIDILRAAAPWQILRRAQLPPGQAASNRIQVRAEDFHIRRIKQKTGTTTIFVVDASGSAALHRLAEAKGAVELLLADCYVRRDQVAVLAFRGRSAELLLPPTRSLVRAKRSLSGLPGGGGTPLAAAIDAAALLADSLRRKGQSPVIVLLTDGRANVARDGSGGREKAQAEAMQAATRLRLLQAAVLLIDTSPQPDRMAAQLALTMHARYLPLPHAGAAAMSQAVRAAMQSGA